MDKKRTGKTKGNKAGGAGTNLNGLSFETDVAIYIMRKFEELNLDVYDHSELDEYSRLGLSDTQFLKIVKNKDADMDFMFGSQGALFKYLEKKQFHKDWTDEEVPKKIKDVWEKDIRPDLFMLNFKGDADKFITFIEVKYQNDSGSVDEKIQTSAFKKEMWNKLFKNLIGPNRIEYLYALSHWFKQKSKKGTDKYYYQDSFDFLNTGPKTLFFLNKTLDYQNKIDEKTGEVELKANSKQPKREYLENDVMLVDVDENEFSLEDLIK